MCDVLVNEMSQRVNACLSSGPVKCGFLPLFLISNIRENEYQFCAARNSDPESICNLPFYSTGQGGGKATDQFRVCKWVVPSHS